MAKNEGVQEVIYDQNGCLHFVNGRITLLVMQAVKTDRGFGLDVAVCPNALKDPVLCRALVKDARGVLDEIEAKYLDGKGSGDDHE